MDGGTVSQVLSLLHGTRVEYILFFQFFNSNSLTLKKPNSLTLKKLNSNSLTLQKSNSNSSITRERIQIQIQSKPTFHSKNSKRILQFAPSKSQSRSHRCVLAHNRCVVNQQCYSLESSIGYSAVARATKVRRNHPKVGGNKVCL